MAKPKPFASEVELCKRFISSLPEGWTAYAESCGWDILLVRDADGFQIGVEAKLRLNTEVISQALEEYGAYSADREGPDCRGVLVPADSQGGFDRICDYIGLTIIYVRSEEQVEAKKTYYGYKPRVFEPPLPGDPHRGSNSNWYEWAPAKRHTLPDYVPDVDAGAPSPVQLTSWKIAAIKIAIILEKRGFLVRADFKHINIDHRRWLPSGAGWLVLDNGVYRGAPGFPDFKAQHPRVWDQIAADFERWKPTDPLAPRPAAKPVPKQETLL
ncbi:hypothetical protein [Bradyrhizobium erythrophlei]|uniref:Uncharacterized protein n=1 Tax=Bradyrhizobium erythrophlei TaxID=1437360 RepID=A0A1H4NQ37_9BRAD|nr:hypothetical protein [Bradyrhizobium erythrophlei]SEB97254.1 hypothetical protein SAMN05444164_0694 [Bradyrhizobium erythrophlei]